MVSLFERHRSKICGMLSCLDRVAITGTLPDICHAQALERHLGFRGFRLFDYPRWAEPMREQIRDNAERLAREAGLRIEFIRRNNFRKEERVKKILAERGSHPGLTAKARITARAKAFTLSSDSGTRCAAQPTPTTAESPGSITSRHFQP